MLEMKKHSKAKLGALVATMAAFATLLGIVQANRPGATSRAQAEEATVAVPSATGTSPVQAAQPRAAQVTQQQTKATHTTTHVS